MQPNIIKNFITKDLCDFINSYLNNNTGEHPVDLNHPKGKRHLMVINNCEVVFFDHPPLKMPEMQKTVFSILDLIQKSTSALFDLPKEEIRVKGLDYTVQETGQSLTMHSDSGVSKNNVYSAILYLTDDYTGGDIVFYDTHLQPDPIPTHYHLEAGTLVYFPGTIDYPHEVLAVESGSRAALIMFFESVNP